MTMGVLARSEPGSQWTLTSTSISEFTLISPSGKMMSSVYMQENTAKAVTIRAKIDFLFDFMSLKL